MIGSFITVHIHQQSSILTNNHQYISNHINTYQYIYISNHINNLFCRIIGLPDLKACCCPGCIWSKTRFRCFIYLARAPVVQCITWLDPLDTILPNLVRRTAVYVCGHILTQSQIWTSIPEAWFCCHFIWHEEQWWPGHHIAIWVSFAFGHDLAAAWLQVAAASRMFAANKSWKIWSSCRGTCLEQWRPCQNNLLWQQHLRTLDGAFLPVAPPCSLYVGISQGTHKRSEPWVWFIRCNSFCTLRVKEHILNPHPRHKLS